MPLLLATPFLVLVPYRLTVAKLLNPALQSRRYSADLSCCCVGDMWVVVLIGSLLLDPTVIAVSQLPISHFIIVQMIKIGTRNIAVRQGIQGRHRKIMVCTRAFVGQQLQILLLTIHDTEALFSSWLKREWIKPNRRR